MSFSPLSPPFSLLIPHHQPLKTCLSSLLQIEILKAKAECKEWDQNVGTCQDLTEMEKDFKLFPDPHKGNGRQ